MGKREEGDNIQTRVTRIRWRQKGIFSCSRDKLPSSLIILIKNQAIDLGKV